MPILENRLKHVNARVWNTQDSMFEFPEKTDANGSKTDLLDRPNTGVCFSGGGTRTAACTIGQLRGLHDIEVIGKIRYISCVSGGAWAAVPYTYLLDGKEDPEFLGARIDPENLTKEDISKLDRNSYVYAVSKSELWEKIAKHYAKGARDETFSRALGDVFLEGFGLNDLNRLFTFDEKTLTAALKRNPAARECDFYTTRPGRPYLIAGGTLLRTTIPGLSNRKMHFEMTPMYSGVHVLHRKAGALRQNIGGGYVESFGFDSKAPSKKPDSKAEVSVELGAPGHRFTLSDVLGTSGAAPKDILKRANLNFLGFPKFRHWPIINRAGFSRFWYVYDFGDGGHLENLGIMPLLKRRVEKIVIFVNSKRELKKNEIDGAVPPLFGKGKKKKLNHVFPENKYADLAKGLLSSQEAGNTAMHRDIYEVLFNEHYGVAGKYKVDVLWIYNARVKNWVDSLTFDHGIGEKGGRLENFPWYETFLENEPFVIDLTAPQASLLAHLSCWNVTSNKKIFQDLLA